LREEGLRSWLAKQLKKDPDKDPVMAALWKDLEVRGHAEDARKIGRAGNNDLLEAARALLPYAELMAGIAKAPNRGRKEPPAPTLRLTGYEAKRAGAIGEFLALRASAHPLVRRFRDEALEGGTVSPEQARALVDSPAASRFSTSWFKDRGIPTADHAAHFDRHDVLFDGGHPGRFVEFDYIFVDPPGDLFRAYLPMSVGYEELEYFRYPNEGSKIQGGEHYSALWRDEEYDVVPVYPGSLLDDLHQLSRRLTREPFHAWTEAQMARFVLTGEVVAPQALTARYDSLTSEHLTHGTITLTIEPWVPTKTVIDVYQYLQKYMLGRKPRAPSQRNLDVFSFVMRQVRSSFADGGSRATAPERFNWSELMERWNRENPGRRYSSQSQFSRDFRRGGNAVVSPYDQYELGWPNLKLSIP
jgi:hypothetical protein